MSELKIIKSENKELRKKLNKDDRNFMMEVGYYLDRYQLSSFEYSDIMNQILRDVISKSDKDKILWDTIENPAEYCDQFLISKVKKSKSFKEEIILMLILFTTLTSLYVLIMNFTTSIPEVYVKEGTFVLTIGMSIKVLSIQLFSLVPIIIIRNKPFDQNRYKVRFLSVQVLSLFFALLLGSIMEYSFVVNVDKYIIYGIVLIGMTILSIKRKLI